MEEQNFRFCKRCLTRDMIDQDEYFRTLQELIVSVQGEERASDELYEERLSFCKECDRLADGLCRACGCYVEYRSVFKENTCPYGKW